MDIKKRVTISRLLNKVNEHKDFTKQIGIKNATYFQGAERGNTKTKETKNNERED